MQHMSKDYLPRPADFHTSPEVTERIYEIMDEIDQTLDILNEPIQYSDPLEEVMQNVTRRARREQLTLLSEFVFEIAEHQDYTEPIDLDAPGLIDWSAFRPDGFPLRTDFYRQKVGEGEQLGTEDMLAFLVPPDITELTERETHFLPWKKQLLQRKYPDSFNKDGSGTVRFPTRLPNIEVTYTYVADSDTPVRTIALAEPRQQGGYVAP